MKQIVADIETNGLLDTPNLCVHSLVLRDVETSAVVSCTDSAPAEWYTEAREGYRRARLAEGYRLLEEAERVYWHNGIKFDFPALTKVNGREPHSRETMRDTLVIAQSRFAHIKDKDYEAARAKKFPSHLAGSHMLEAWGYRLGVHKGEYTKWCDENGIADPWGAWRPEMQSYCEGDTDTGRALVLHLRDVRVAPEAVEIEHELAWYLAQQERNGWPFDVERAVALQARLSARREELRNELVELVGILPFRNGKPVTPKRNDAKRGIYAGCPYSKLKWSAFNPGSRPQVARILTSWYGWEPVEYTTSGQPKMDEANLKGLPASNPIAARIIEYLVVGQRLGSLSEGDESLMHHMTREHPDGGKLTGMYHIHHRVKQNFAVTHRASHVSPNINLPKVGKPYGSEFRELMRVPEGWVQVGADAASLEARCLGHYLAKYDGGAYAKILLEGDVHSANRVALGMPDGKVYRDASKNWYYAWMYGGGDLKLGKMLARPMGLNHLTDGQLKRLGAQKRAAFLMNTPAMGMLIAWVQGEFKDKKKGFVKMPDGRRTYIRSEHSALNTLLQAAGAIICKRWIVNFNRRLVAEFGPQGWNGQWAALGWVHDEVQIACRPEIAQRVCEILVEEMRAITTHFRWRIPLDGEAKIGGNWKETH